MRMTFDVETPDDLLERVLLPTYKDFLADNASSRHALTGILVAFHLFDWVTDTQFEEKVFRRWYSGPGHDQTLEYFKVAQKLALGFKHHKPDAKRKSPRANTTFGTGFSSDFSDDFQRPFNIQGDNDREISADELLEALVAFWTDQQSKGWPKPS